MQSAIYHTEWVNDDSSESRPLAGVLLGYSKSKLHTRGVPHLMAQLGISQRATTVLDSKITRIPSELRFQEFELPRIDRRRKLRTAALLTLVNAERMKALPTDPVQRARALGVLCTVLPYMGKAESQMLTAWDEGGFAICVTGAQNIANLKELHAAFLRRDVAVVHPYVRGLIQGGLGFCITSRLPKDLESEINALNADSHKAREVFQESAISARLVAHQMRFASLHPQWDAANNQLMLCFRPHHDDKSQLASGWYSLPEVELLLAHTGPLVKPPPAIYEPLLELSGKMIAVLKEAGVKFAYPPNCYVDEGTPYLSLYLSEPHSTGLKTGKYSLTTLNAIFSLAKQNSAELAEAA